MMEREMLTPVTTERKKGGCYGSTNLGIGAPRGSWRKIFVEKPQR